MAQSSELNSKSKSINCWASVDTVKPLVLQITRQTGYLQFWQKINGQTSKFARKLHFLGIRKVLNLGLKAEKPLQNENHTDDWALGSHPRDNGHVTH